MFNEFVSWLKNPLNTETGNPSALTLFLFIGLVLVLIASWGLLFRHLRAVA
jgi:LPXTG-motif cell wall-anchored protein